MIFPADNDHYDAAHEVVALPPAAPLKARVYSATAKLLYRWASHLEHKAFGYLFVSGSRVASDADLTPIVMEIDQSATLKKALENADVREAVLSGYVTPRRSELEQLDLIRANCVLDQGSENQHEFVWADPSGNAGNSADGDVMGPNAR